MKSIRDYAPCRNKKSEDNFFLMSIVAVIISIIVFAADFYYVNSHAVVQETVVEVDGYE